MKTQDNTDQSNWRSPLAWVLQWPIRLYRMIPRSQERCRFHPTCSAYGLEALRVHGVLRGGYLTTRRLLRCHPWGGMGIDPVPSAAKVKNTKQDKDNHSHDAQSGIVKGSEEHVV